jgi:PPOX class probable F420-dependent enzyme
MRRNRSCSRCRTRKLAVEEIGGEPSRPKPLEEPQAPVWFVQEGARLLVETDADSYKVRFIRRNPSVTVAVCTATGRTRGEHVAARAELLADSETARVQRLIAEKYRTDLIFIRPIRALQTLLQRGRPRPTLVVVAITPT